MKGFRTSINSRHLSVVRILAPFPVIVELKMHLEEVLDFNIELNKIYM